jgi:hypothetical protein
MHVSVINASVGPLLRHGLNNHVASGDGAFGAEDHAVRLAAIAEPLACLDGAGRYRDVMVRIIMWHVRPPCQVGPSPGLFTQPPGLFWLSSLHPRNQQWHK